MRILKTRKGVEIRTPYTDSEAAERLHIYVTEGSLTSFAADLSKAWKDLRATEEQIKWIHKLVIDYETSSENSFPKIRSMIDKAGEGLKYPKIRIAENLLVKRNGRGLINVTDGGPFGNNKFYGVIDLDGSFRDRNTPKEILQLLKDFEENPEEKAKAFGLAYSYCCFCSKLLTTPESLTAGYGPICANNYGLSWGHVSNRVKLAKLKNRLAELGG